MPRLTARTRPLRSRAPRQRVKIEFRKNDTVRVIAGKDKGKTGRVLVEGVQMVKRHTRPNPSRQIKGGIAERESPIAVSNLMLVCSECGPVRIRHRVEAGGGKARRIRICGKCGAPLEKK